MKKRVRRKKKEKGKGADIVRREASLENGFRRGEWCAVGELRLLFLGNALNGLSREGHHYGVGLEKRHSVRHGGDISGMTADSLVREQCGIWDNIPRRRINQKGRASALPRKGYRIGLREVS